MKLRIILVFSIYLISHSLFAQYVISIDAVILDKTNNKPIPFAFVSFKEKAIKTIANKEGEFLLNFEEAFINKVDLVEFSAYGYETQEVNIDQLYRLLKNSSKIYLKPITTSSIKNKIGKSASKDKLNGRVTSNNLPLQGVSVKVKNTLTESKTDFDGNFSINANDGDVIIFEFLGMKSKEVLVKSDILKIELETSAEILDEVTLIGKSKKEETIDLGQNVKKNFDAIGTSINTIKSEDIKSHYYDLSDLLLGRFAALNHSREASINNLQGKIFDIDGMIFTGTDIPPIDPQNIQSLTILTSLASTTKYGSLGRGGVIIIRTKTASGGKAEPKKPSALVTGNDYEEQVQSIEALNLKPDYLQTFLNAKTFEEAKQVYKTLKLAKDNLSVAFYLEAAEYFLNWDQDYAIDTFNYIEDLAKDNAKALKSLAFKYESLNMLEKARLVYQRITLLRPTDAQSYRDLALIYVSTGYYNEAMRLYKQMLSNSIKGVDFSGLQQPITDELMHLLATHRSKVDYTDIPADVLATKFKQDLRIVFEWNDPNAEFELQFVNPQKKFFKWAHTKFDNRERMLDEIKKGYTTEAYIIDDADAGEWIINIEALGETPDINPNYLKYTIYKNYGLPNETKTVKVIQLESITQKVTLDKFMYE